MTSATMIATPVPGPPTSVATTNPDIEATAPTERSMPPVSIVSVWHPARIASGTAARSMTPTQSAFTIPGRAISLRTTSRPRRASSGMIGRSRNSRRHPAAVSQVLRSFGGAVTALMRASVAAG